MKCCKAKSHAGGLPASNPDRVTMCERNLPLRMSSGYILNHNTFQIRRGYSFLQAS